MTCPSDEQLTLLSMDVLQPSQVSELNEHLLACPACRERFNRARREHAALVRTYEVLDRDHDERREQLLASLPAEAPRPVTAGWGRRGWRRLGEYVMNNPRVRLTTATIAAAACIVFAVTLLFMPGESLALAGIGEALQQTKTVICRIAIDITGGQLEQSLEGKTYLSDEHGSRTELYTGEELTMLSISPVDGPTVSGRPGEGRHFRFTHDYRDEDADPGRLQPDEYIRRLHKLTGEAERGLGVEVIDGQPATGYEIAGEKLGLVATSPGGETEVDDGRVVVRLWVDVKTLLPVRYTIRMPGPEQGTVMTLECDQFEWDVPLEESLFDPQVLESDEGSVLDLHVPQATEEALIEGLQACVDIELLGGRYPATLNFTQIGMEVFQYVSAQPEGQRSAWGAEPQDVMQQMMPLYAGTLYYQKLIRDGAEAEYFGQVVEPGDAEAVLVRWTLQTGETRVIYGDLSAETLPAAGE